MKPFSLTPGFCLHNGAVVLNQGGPRVSLGLVDPGDEKLCRRLEKAFVLWLEKNSLPLEDWAVEFVKITRDRCAREVSRLFTPAAYAEGRTRAAADSGANAVVAANAAPDSGAASPATAGVATDAALGAALEESPAGAATGVATGVALEESPAIALLDSLVNEALAAGATDIHIGGVSSGPQGGAPVRFRVRGRLMEHIVFNEKTAETLGLRIKNLARLNTLEKRRPQDGQFLFAPRGRAGTPVAVRVSCMPALGGEAFALRLLDSSRVPLEPEKLGFAPEVLERILSLLECDDGLILVCGPTGSGKSTTLASLLTLLQTRTRGSKKIITIEDPVEYVLEGITQIQTNAALSLDFDEILRRIFRQDPDVIMLGEIRDHKTAAVALSASLTGHLVFATLHTTGKEETLIRLKDLGADEGLIASVLRGVISQRLIEDAGALRLEGNVTVFGRKK